MLCRFREIVNRLKVMAQLLRPPPKRRPSQIASQASAGSQSVPSQPALASQHPSTTDLATAADAAAKGILSPCGPSSRPPLGSPTKTSGAEPAQQKLTAAEGAEQVPDRSKINETSSIPSDAPPQHSVDETASDSKFKSSEEYVSPFEQAQEPAASEAAQGKSPAALCRP